MKNNLIKSKIIFGIIILAHRCYGMEKEWKVYEITLKEKPIYSTSNTYTLNLYKKFDNKDVYFAQLNQEGKESLKLSNFHSIQNIIAQNNRADKFLCLKLSHEDTKRKVLVEAIKKGYINESGDAAIKIDSLDEDSNFINLTRASGMVLFGGILYAYPYETIGFGMLFFMTRFVDFLSNEKDFD